jgi:hypothetical protein
MTYPHHPRFGSNYRGLTNRLDLLLECYAYLPFEERVQTARAWQIETLAWVAAHGDEVRQVVDSSRTPPPRVAVRYALEAFPDPITIPTRTPRTLEGAPSEVRLMHHARFVGTVMVDRPPAYAVPPVMAAHLRLHGLDVEPLAGAVEAQVATIESTGTEGGRKILEAGSTGQVAVRWRTEARAVPEGWARVATDQPLGAVAVYLCEPESDDGAAENGLVPAPVVGQDHPIWRLGA